ncbi:MAG: M24 family metallopeptidase, partial [Alphaproteobacteria bacterium]|nr:M24 family metallopeptidase [Alphaproteobacteria bacterium]
MVFERVEYARRLAATRAAMAKAGIDVLVEADPANMYWLTGYDGWSYYVPQAVLVPQTEDEPVWIGRGLDLTGARLTAHMKPENILAFPEDLFERKDRHPMQFFAAEMARRGWNKGSVGLAKDCQTFTQRSREALVASLPNARAVPSDLLVNWLRLVKSPAEIAYMRAAARITERIMATFFAMTAPGVRECDVAAELQKVATEGHGGVAGDYPASIPFIAAGPFVATTHLTWTERRFEAGETASVQA